jgi:hypothetical protein
LKERGALVRREVYQEVPFSDLVDLIDAFYAMWNTQHIDGVLSFFTDDAIITTVGDPREAPAVYCGKAEIRNFVQTHLPRWHVHSRSHYRAGATRIV